MPLQKIRVLVVVRNGEDMHRITLHVSQKGDDEIRDSNPIFTRNEYFTVVL